ncbi:YceI family protein [Parasphingopyxis sp.]|uniref:YceI family protein n=1 Tax=Parasphingopyxis sp. TaxID=1920299 RepID=UPI0026276C3B|nr:YceI family protein [Parasphingopyxis sp.]
MIATLRTAMPTALVALTACSQAPADPASLTEGAWALDNAASELSYVTIKEEEVAELNSFEELSGSVSPDGAANIEIDLASVNTGVDIRDERMRDILFVVTDHPTATVTAQIDPASFETLGVGESTGTTIEGTLSLTGIDAPVRGDVTVTRIGPDRVLVVSDAPIIVEARRFELLDGLAQLQAIVELSSITPVVPVSFSLTFER